MKKIFKLYKPILFLLAAFVLLLIYLSDSLLLGNTMNWDPDYFVLIAIIFSLLSVINGILYIRHEQRRGLLFIYDILAIVVGTITLFGLLFYYIFFVLTLFGGPAQD
jgi:hypothetical protein